MFIIVNVGGSICEEKLTTRYSTMLVGLRVILAKVWLEVER